MADLHTDVRYIKGIGEKKAQALHKLGVFSIYDLISFFPRKYEDRSQFKPIALTMDGETVCIQALVADTPRLSHIRRGMDIVKLRAVDDSGSVDITFFNQPYAKDNLHRGESYNFFGRVELRGGRRTMANPVYEPEDRAGQVTGRIIPVYRLCAGLNQRSLMQAIRQGLDSCLELLPDILPDSVRQDCQLAQARYAYENIHFPADFQALELARRRLIFEELFVLSCALGRMHRERSLDEGIKLKAFDMEEFWRSLPFAPTGAQRRAVAQAAADMASGAVMSRLVQGDVGSGKTLVAAALIWLCAKNGYTSAFMAPTEILAEQHYHTLTGMLAPFSLRVGKLTGSMSAKEKRAVKVQLQQGQLDLLVGTHALISQDVEYDRLALVVTDEQHRFGVEQRARLSNKSANAPDVLVMTATPIPRTLALTVYGDLDISVMKGRPPQRKPVRTLCYTDERRREVYAGLVRQVQAGRQAYVVCPLIEESDVLAVHSAERVYEELKRDFLQDIPCALLHGRLKGAEKDGIMSSFAAGEL